MTKKQAEQLSGLIRYRHEHHDVRARVIKPFDDRHGYRVLAEKGPGEAPERFFFAAHKEYAESREVLSAK